MYIFCNSESSWRESRVKEGENKLSSSKVKYSFKKTNYSRDEPRVESFATGSTENRVIRDMRVENQR